MKESYGSYVGGEGGETDQRGKTAWRENLNFAIVSNSYLLDPNKY